MEHEPTTECLILVVSSDKNQCKVCKMNFSNVSNLRRHARNLHPTLVKAIAPLHYKQSANFAFNCHICGKNYNYKSNMTSHMKTHEGTTAFNNKVKKSKKGAFICSTTNDMKGCFSTKHDKVEIKIEDSTDTGEDLVGNSKLGSKGCPLCAFVCSEAKDMMQHISTEHEIQINMEELCFSSEKAFYSWKETIEDQTISRFIIQRTHHLKNYSYSGFSCNRSGFYNPSGLGIRRLKIHGSNKINGYCPAGLKLRINHDDKSCNVEYISTHVGHQQDAWHIQLRSSERSTQMVNADCNAGTFDDSIDKNEENQITLDQISNPLQSLKEEIKFLSDSESVSSFSELDVVKRAVTPLISTFDAIKQEDTSLPVPKKTRIK